MVGICKVFGNPIHHSLSPQIHTMFGQQTAIQIDYQAQLVAFDDFERAVASFFAMPNSCGLNITVPFKQRAFAMAETTSSRAQQCQAANTLYMRAGVLHADTTDGIGIMVDLERLHWDVTDAVVAIIGAGGAARTIAVALAQRNIGAMVGVNRTVQRTLAMQQLVAQVSDIAFTVVDFSAAVTQPIDFVFNATPLSLIASENTVVAGWLQQLVAANPTTPTLRCYDLAYALNGETWFTQTMQGFGADAVDGLGMLVEQAAAAYAIWHGVTPTTLPVIQQLRKNA